MTPYDALPIEARRLNWGWFGEPWPSGVCYDDDGNLLADMRKPVPVGEKCIGCGEVIAEGDQGQTMGVLALTDQARRLAHMHKECLLRDVVGSLAHLEGASNCRCRGGTGKAGLTSRQDALAVWAWIQEHGITPL